MRTSAPLGVDKPGNTARTFDRLLSCRYGARVHWREQIDDPSEAALAVALPEDRFRGLVFHGKKTEQAIRAGHRPFAGTAKAQRLVGSQVRNPAAVAPELESFARRVLGRAGLCSAAYRLSPLLRRIPACLRALKVETPEAAWRKIEIDPAWLNVAVNSLLIGATSFFRDAPVFEQLESRVIPLLLKRKPFPRVWSVSCSDGAELYSVGMLLAERGALGGGQLLGSDCRVSAVAAARRGVFSEVARASLGERWRAYQAHGSGPLTMAPALARCLSWECRDVLKSQPPGKWDMIFCRNLAIYLEAGAASAMWERLAAALNPGGYLVVGKAERPSALGFTRVGPCIFRKNLV